MIVFDLRDIIFIAAFAALTVMILASLLAEKIGSVIRKRNKKLEEVIKETEK